MTNEAVPLFRERARITVLVTADVVGKTFADVSASVDPVTGLIRTAACATGARALGVFAADKTSGQRGSVIIEPGVILDVQCGGTVTPGALVQVGTNAKAVTRTSGVAVAKALSAGADGADITVKMF